MTKLKCWKKIGVVPNRWRNNGMITDVSLSKSDSHYLTKPGWVASVKHERSNQYFEDKVFLDKSKALKFAKKYMKEHDC